MRLQGQLGESSWSGGIGLGRLEDAGSSAWAGSVGGNQYQKHMNSLPNGLGASTPLTTVILSQETFRLPIIPCRLEFVEKL